MWWPASRSPASARRAGREPPAPRVSGPSGGGGGGVDAEVDDVAANPTPTQKLAQRLLL